MTELLLCAVFIPIIFLASKKTSRVALWIPALVGAVCTGYFVWLRSSEPLLWGGLAVFLAMTLSEVSEQKTIQPFTVLGALFFAQSLLAQNIGVVIICIAFGDLFLNVEIFSRNEISEKNRAIQNICRSLFSLLPVTFGVLLGLSGHYIILAVSVTVLLRIFSWPFPHWILESKKDSSFFNLLVSGISSFALWRGLDFSAFPEWAMIWMIITALLSLGAQYTEVYIAMTLGAFCVSPAYGLLAAAIWPLLVYRGKSIYFVTLFTAIIGALISEAASKVIIENTVYALGGVSALILARPFVSFKIEERPWVNEGRDFLLSAILCGLFIYVLTVQVPVIGPFGGAFTGVFLLTYTIGKVIYSKHPKFFRPLEGLKGPLIPDLTEPVSSLNERAGGQINLGESPFAIKFYQALESESHLIWLLGLLGVALYWGVR
jgi:hypothetical protein